MPDISKLTMPNGIVYDLKDTVAREMAKHGGGSGVSDYNDLENTPISLVEEAKIYTNADQIGEAGTWSDGVKGRTMAVKIIEPLSIDDLEGSILTLKVWGG